MHSLSLGSVAKDEGTVLSLGGEIGYLTVEKPATKFVHCMFGLSILIR